MPAPTSLRLSLRQLEIFLAVASAQTTAAAAIQLALSQSAVSAGLKALEAHYDVMLFDRVGKHLVLNAVGQRMRTQAEDLIARARELESELTGHGQIGDLKIAASYTIANHLVVDYLTQWLGVYPDAKVDIATSNSPDVVAQVLDHQVDIGLIENEINHPELELIPWLGDELLVFCSPTNHLAYSASVTDEALLSARWILREKGSGARQRFDQTFARLLPTMQIYLEFRHNQPIQQAVEQGLGLGCLSDRVLRPYIEAGSLVPLKLSENYRMQRRFFFALRRAGFRRPAVDEFITLCKTSLG